MGAQSIIDISITSIKDKEEDNLIKNAEKYIFNKYYKLGEAPCSFDYLDSTKIYNIIEKNICALNSLINAKLQGLEDCETSEREQLTLKTTNFNMVNNSNKNTDSLYGLWLSRGNNGSMDYFLDLILKNDDIYANWDEILR